jgi:hypothetical protein
MSPQIRILFSMLHLPKTGTVRGALTSHRHHRGRGIFTAAAIVACERLSSDGGRGRYESAPRSLSHSPSIRFTASKIVLRGSHESADGAQRASAMQ